ncbi:putative DNA methylase [uncultured Mediterranean phage uvMED]|nr:putative DNA methylase [uncultured Mediterranean phage uvMED]
MNYYNENNKYASQWLKNLVREKLIPEGKVDDRGIEDVQPEDLKGFNQCHFFAGIGGWAYALQLAGWDSNRPVWTGSCPCQSFSIAGQRKGASDERHLWPAWFRLIRESKPATIFGEQVVGAISFGWLDAVATDLEACDYRFASAVLSGYTVGAYHKRQRLWFVADTTNDGRSKSQSDTQSRGIKRSEEEGRLFESKGERSHVANSDNSGWHGRGSEAQQERKEAEQDNGSRTRSSPSRLRSYVANPVRERPSGSRGLGESRDSTPGQDRQEYRANDVSRQSRGKESLANSISEGLQGFNARRSSEEREISDRSIKRCDAVNWGGVEWVRCKDGKTRPIPLEPDVLPLVDGVPEVMDSEGNPRKYSYSGSLKGIGNAIIPQVAAVFISSYLDI